MDIYGWLTFFFVQGINNIVNYTPLKEKNNEMWTQRTPALNKLEMAEIPVKGDTKRNRQYGMLNLEQIYHVKSAHSFLTSHKRVSRGYYLGQSHAGRRQWHPTPVLLPGKSHGWRSLVGCSPWGRWESDTTERLHFHFSLSCLGEGNGNPIQCSCLENPRDGGAWWAAVYGVAQSRTRLKWLSSSS